MLPLDGDASDVPQQLQQRYRTIRSISQSTYFNTLECTFRSNQSKYFMRTIDPKSKFFKSEPSNSSTMFIQEALYLCTTTNHKEKTIKIEDFTMEKKKIAVVMKPYHSLAERRKDEDASKKKLKNNASINFEIEKMLRTVSADVDYLLTKMNFKKIALALDLICYYTDTGTFFLCDWARSTVVEHAKSRNSLDSSGQEKIAEAAKEIYQLGLLSLELFGLAHRDLSFREQKSRCNFYAGGESLKELVQKMLTQEQGFQGRPTNLCKSPPLKLKALQSIKKETESGHLKIAWCSHGTNLISVYDTKTQKRCIEFKGAQLMSTGWTYTYVEHLPDSNYLLSLNHRGNSSAKFEIYDAPSNVKRIYSHQEIFGGVSGGGDFTCNARRKLAALISVKAQIPGLDFDPEGKKIMMMDESGVCLLSDVDTGHYIFDVKAGEGEQYGGFKRCRWNPLLGSPLVAVKFDRAQLNLIDSEKKSLIHKEPILLDDSHYWSLWIDWRQDGNLLACGCYEKVKFYDRREGRIVKSYDNLHTDYVRSVRWSPDGTTFVSAAADRKIKHIEFSSGEVIYTADTTDRNAASSICFIRGR